MLCVNTYKQYIAKAKLVLYQQSNYHCLVTAKNTKIEKKDQRDKASTHAFWLGTTGKACHDVFSYRRGSNVKAMRF